MKSNWIFTSWANLLPSLTNEVSTDLKICNCSFFCRPQANNLGRVTPRRILDNYRPGWQTQYSLGPLGIPKLNLHPFTSWLTGNPNFFLETSQQNPLLGRSSRFAPFSLESMMGISLLPKISGSKAPKRNMYQKGITKSQGPNIFPSLCSLLLLLLFLSTSKKQKLVASGCFTSSNFFWMMLNHQFQGCPKPMVPEVMLPRSRAPLCVHVGPNNPWQMVPRARQ